MANLIKKWQVWAIVAIILAAAAAICWKGFAAGNEEIKKAAEFVESAYSETESEIIAQYSEYGVTAVEGYGIALNMNSYPSVSSGEAVSTAFSWANKEAGTYSFNKKTAQKELAAESLNPIWVSARAQALFERGDDIVAYLTKTKSAEQKLKTQPLKDWLKKDDAGNAILKDGKYFLTEEYLQIALAMFRLSNDEMAFATEYSVETVANPVIIWRKTVLTDSQTVLKDLKTVRKDNYSEDEKWDDVLKVVQKNKDGTIISTELFNIYDKAPVIPQETTVIPTQGNTGSGGSSGGGGDTPPSSPTKNTSSDPVNQGNAQTLGGSNKSTDGTGTYQATRPEQATDTQYVGSSSGSDSGASSSGSSSGTADSGSGTKEDPYVDENPNSTPIKEHDSSWGDGSEQTGNPKAPPETEDVNPF